MSMLNTIRAWKDPDFRENLSEEGKSKIAQMPIGEYELDHDVMKNIVGGDICLLFSGIIIRSEGAVCTVSGECNSSGESCNPT